MTSNNNTLIELVGALELHILLGEFVAVDFKQSRFTMKWNESESEVVYSDPAIDMSRSNGCLFRSSDLLPTTYYVPPTTYYLLPPTYYLLLPTTYYLGGGGGGGGVRLSKNPRGETNHRLKPTQAILTKTIHKTRRQAGGLTHTNTTK